jgi:Flp pilus assembly pilin Flp
MSATGRQWSSQRSPVAEGDSGLRKAMRVIRTLLADEGGQDMVEYVLLLAFVALATAGIVIGMGSTTSTFWSITNSRLQNSNN